MKTIRKLFCCLLVTALLLPLAGCAAKTQKIDWDLYGTWVTENGEIGETVHFSMEGTLDADTQIGTSQSVDFHIQWPDGFVYKDSEPQTCSVFAYTGETDSLWFMCCATSYEPTSNRPAAEVFYLDPEREAVVFSWSDRDGCYLVASTAPDADPLEMLAFFDGFTKEYVIDD